MASAIDTYLKQLTLLHPKAIDLSLDRIWRLLARLDHPEAKLPPVFHVAGTNGKGSVTAYLRAILEAANHRVHVYTSPHLIRFNERVRLAGQLIGDAELLALLQECDRVNAGEPITFFEITTVAAFLAFARTPADALVLEVGLGGRLDTTNTIPSAAVSVITPISLDHTGFLGETIAKIAFEKAGILRRGVHAVIAPQTSEAAQVIRTQGAHVAAPLTVWGTGPGDWRHRATESGLELTLDGETVGLPAPALVGVHQPTNAATAAVAARRAREFRISWNAIASGLTRVVWPGRLQRLGAGPLVGRLPPDAEVWLDGAHNPAGGEALAATLAQWQTRDPRPLHVVVGMMQTKDAASFLGHFVTLRPRLWAVAIPNEGTSFAAEALAASAASVGLEARPGESVAATLDSIARAGARAPRVVICGSIYLAGAVLATNGEPVA
ncbi:MAG: bifunctional folylpolyglutamate synthase/dihydrofolate synthase [Alphaproteobacteria bacterium]|nr:bifunctional folylpolyglutamate synthase/dihydrofolate synthase [Alphaproteobacteria bacterium]